MIIKFRAKDIETKEWRYGYYAVILGQHKIINSSGQEYFVDEGTVGQYLGVRDKRNLQEIYEGDVIRCYDTSGEKVYDEEATMAGRYTEIWFDGTCDIEVIGNVTENPELLTQQDKPMEQEKQVCSRPLGEKMKALGFPQDSVFKYCGGHIDYSEAIEGNFEKCENTDLLDDDEYCHTAGLTCEFTFAAYSVAELGEMLSESASRLTLFRAYLKVMELPEEEDVDFGMMCINLMTQPDIPAEMLIWLAEHNLIFPKDINI